MKRLVKLSTFVLFLSLLVTGCFSVQENNGEKLERKQNFDYNWKFALGDYPDASAVSYVDTSWRKLDLPHDWSIEGQIARHNPTGNDGGYFPAGIGWYRKIFDVPNEWKNRKIGIYFEGVYMNAEVFINGQSLGMHPYGYTSFFFDLTPYVEYGKENLIAVRVDNSQQKNCRWYSGSGIYRHVWIKVTDPIHVANWGIAITTPEVSKDSATIEVKTRIKNETGHKQKLELITAVSDQEQQEVGKASIQVEIDSKTEQEITQTIQVEKPLLWSPQDPYLYTAQSVIKKVDQVVDEVTTNVGIRSISYSAEDGFKLNGETIQLNGGCVHHDNGVLGAAAYDRAEERKVELLKSAGFNAVRTSHNPPSLAFLSACDRLGLLVIDESFDGWKEQKTPYDYASILDQCWKSDIEAMVLRDRNHPSIIMWSSGNEIIERTKLEAVETAHMLNNYIRELDPIRPVTSAMTSWNQGWEIFDPLMAEHDICGYNYMMQEAESDHDRVPSRIIVQTESYPKDAFYNWKMVRDHNYIIGDFVWTAMDYLGESSIGRYYYPGEPEGQHWEQDFYPWHGAYCGDIDLTGWRKPISHYRNLLWNDTEKLYLAVREPNPDSGSIKTTMWAVWPTWESWNWPGYEGKDIQVEVYSEYPKVRLYLNDKLIGEEQTGLEQEFKATFNVAYTPGVLKAVGSDGDNAMETSILKTAGKASQIRLTADRAQIKANGQDLSYITVEVTDAEGNIVPNAENEIQFTLAGEGTIAGVGDGNMKEVEPYVNDRCTVWKGRALVVIKSTHKTGALILQASSTGLNEASISIKAVE